LVKNQLLVTYPSDPPSLIILLKGRGVKIREGAKPPPLKSLPPLFFKERGIKGVRFQYPLAKISDDV
jgi:hypothetical protein